MHDILVHALRTHSNLKLAYAKYNIVHKIQIKRYVAMIIFYYHSISRIYLLPFPLPLSFPQHPSLDHDLIVDRARVFTKISILLYVLYTRIYVRTLRDNVAFPLQYLRPMENKRKQGDLADTRAIC